MPAVALSRRGLLRGAAAGVGATLAWPVPGLAHHDDTSHRKRVVPPTPIPGGIEIPQLIHVWVPGPTTLTLPFSGGVPQGLDTEPATLTDFAGFSAMAYHVGTATGDDGTTYNLET